MRRSKLEEEAKLEGAEEEEEEEEGGGGGSGAAAAAARPSMAERALFMSQSTALLGWS
jgi:hypothetical protein